MLDNNNNNYFARTLSLLSEIEYGQIFCLIDEKVENLYQISPLFIEKLEAKIIFLKASEENKSEESLNKILNFLIESRASRNDILINIGGGMISDIGGFAASIYKRGVRHINIATTFMAMIDAAIGGKTAINFNGVKNLIGSFHKPIEVIADKNFLSTLSEEEILSAYGEMLKYSILIGGEMYYSLMRGDYLYSYDIPEDYINKCIEYKNQVVEEDLYDNGRRRYLNLGHSMAHALEALAMKKKQRLSHGHAVAIGLVIEAYIARKYYGLKNSFSDLKDNLLYHISQHVKEAYPIWGYSCKDYDDILYFLSQDKKNNDERYSFVVAIKATEISEIFVEDIAIIKEALDYYRDFFGA